MKTTSIFARPLAALAVTLSLALPVQAETELTKLLPESIREAGVLRVMASNSGSPPMIYIGEDARTLEGLEIELTHAVGAALGIELEFLTGTFDSLIPAIAADRADFAVGSIGDLKKRQEQVSFVDYVKAGVGMATLAGNVNGAVDLDGLCGKSVAAVRGTFQERELSTQKEKCEANGSTLEVQTFAESNAAVLALRSGRSDVWSGDSGPVGYAVAQSEGKLVVAGEIRTIALLGYAVAKENKELQAALKAALEAVMASGKYKEIFEKWGQEGTMVDEITINKALL